MANPTRPFRSFRLPAALLLAFLFFYFHGYLGSPGSHGKGGSHLRITKSSYDWGAVTPTHAADSLQPLPRGHPQALPRVQHPFHAASRFEISKREPRQQNVKKVFEKCWRNYKKHAWMQDELTPVTGVGKDTLGGWAATLIDSLDTLWIMEMKEEFAEAVDAVATIDWAKTADDSCNMFETTIRHLGGLLAAFDLSGSHVLLMKAIELGDMLYAGFDTPNRMPVFRLNFQAAKDGVQEAGAQDPSAASGSLTLEFSRLSQITGDPKYYDAVRRVTEMYRKHQNDTMIPGLWPKHVNLRDEKFSEDNSFSLGALADSLYEYLPKTHALLGGLEPAFESMYHVAAEAITKHLLFRPMLPKKDDVLFSGLAKVNDGDVHLTPEVQHLACFAGGMFALGGRLFARDEHFEIGRRLTQGCVYAYGAFPVSIMPEVSTMLACESLDGCDWDEDRWASEGDAELPQGFSTVRDPRYYLRPEAAESLFLLYRMTGREDLQDAAWHIFQQIVRATSTEYGNAGIASVLESGTPEKLDSMESFWTAETLKYLYLTFSDPALLNLDQWVFNTEAHPFKRPTDFSLGGNPHRRPAGT